MSDLDEGRIIDRDNQVVQQYVYIDGDNIDLLDGWIGRFRIIIADFFKLLDDKGLLVFQK